MKWDVFVNCKIAAGGFVCFEQKLLHSRSQQPWVWCCGIALESSIRTLATVGGPLGARGHHGARGAARADGSRRRLRRVHVRLLLGLHDVLLVAYPLVSEPVAHLQVNVKYCSVTINILAQKRLMQGIIIYEPRLECGRFMIVESETIVNKLIKNI